MPDPHLRADTDVIVGIDAVTICGTDLHILKGDVPEVEKGRVLGHRGSRAGVLHGRMRYLPLLSRGQVWAVHARRRLGTGAHHRRCPGRVRACPYGDLSLRQIPSDVSDEAAVLLADILPTSYEVGVLAGQVNPATSW